MEKLPTYKGKQLLFDVVIMRFVLIGMLIIFHSFAPFCGGWEPLKNSADNDLYFWIGKYSYSFFLEAFVFISGLIAGYQALNKPINTQKKYVLKKFKRLMIPSIIFSIIYFLCFNNWDGYASFAISILEGCGHMWFLPMLFWCFVGIYLLSLVNLNPYMTIGFSIVLMLLSNGILPIRIGYSMYYFLFFYLGYTIYKENFRRYLKPNILTILILIIIFIFSVIIDVYYQPSSRIKGIIIHHLIRSVIGFSGLIACYMIITRYVKKISSLPRWLILFSQYSFGIYIMQQFILKALYYHTSLPSIIDYILMPWVGVCCALILSVISTHILLKFKIGRLLIG